MSFDFEGFKAVAGEFEAIPGWFIPGEGGEARPVLVRCFARGDALRLTMEHEQGAGPQLVVEHAPFQRIIASPQP